ncbi:MAG: DUF4388 domain-containing protein [Blastocatellia bacterium]|nr:DUF4388 domain-containing protein [Blastocatellia bacterium]MBN8723970.1 DUF4388 domain-containing protein [Acidobacteriota bacterium]
MSAKDPNQVKYAIADFQMFLAGKRAPALIGQSLATIIRQVDIQQVAYLVLEWARNNKEQYIVDSLVSARNKVFDIFFYRVVKFERIHKFFPTFEQTLISICPSPENAHLAALFQQFKWQDIRPIGTIRDQRFVIEKRQEIKVEAEKFNEDVYKNATFSVLSADKKYSFADEATSNQIAGYQEKVKEIFSDFVDLVEDKQQKKEILLANESDKYNNYQKKEAFKIELYLTQMLDLAIALFNDDFFYQSIQIFTIIRELRDQNNLKLSEIKKFQDKAELFSMQKLEDAANNNANCLLVKQIVSLFNHWQPERILVQLQIEANRRIRRFLLKLLECYGKDVYHILVVELSSKAASLPWWYTRNLAYILGRITTDNDTVKNQAVELLCSYWQPKAQRQLINQIITTLGSIGTDLACERLIERLKIIEPQIEKDKQSAEYYQKIIPALLSIESERSIETALESCLRQEQLSQHIDKFPRAYLSDKTIQYIAGKIRKELQKIKYTFSLLGDKETASELLKIIGHMANEPVKTLCKEIVKALPGKHKLTQEAEKILAQPTALGLYARDKNIQKLATLKNIPEAICQILEISGSGKLAIITTDGVESEIDFERGQATRAFVRAFYLEGDNAFYWSFLLDPRDIEQIYFNSPPSRSEPNISRSTENLISEGSVQRGQILQIAGKYVLPESKFRQKQVNSYYTNFNNTDAPDKYQRVWDALIANTDIASLQQATHLSKHDVYKILFYFLKQNMLIVDGDEEKEKLVDIESGLVTLTATLQRIERRPVMFNYYRTFAEICADLMRSIEDDVIRFAIGVLRNYCLEYYQSRKVFTSVNIEIGQQVLEWVAGYVQNPSAENRQSLLDYISFTFRIEDASLQPLPAPPPEIDENTALEKLENIELGNDPLEGGDEFDESMLDDVFGSLDTILGSGIGVSSGEFGSEDGTGLTDAEDAMIRDLFDNIALAYVKPLKDYVRELYRNWEAERPTSLEWTEIIEPIFSLLSGASAKMGYQQISDAVKDMEKLVMDDKNLAETQSRDSFDQMAAQQIIVAYQKLAELQPKTFALAVSEQDLEDKKEILIVKFVLKQIPEVTEKILSKILFAGLNTFDKFMQTNVDEIAALTGMAKQLAEEIYLKFYQYRNIYYQDDPDYSSKFMAMFDLNLRLLKQMHEEVEILILDEQLGREGVTAHKEELIADRQRMLWSLFILLCIKQEYDLIETIQQSVFDVRVQLLDDYFCRLVLTYTETAVA